MRRFYKFRLETPEREILIDVSKEIKEITEKSNIQEGICRIFIPHTTAGVTINENADPSVKKDIINFLHKLIPKNSGFSHREGNSDAHIKSSIVGSSIKVIIHKGELVLGTWQGIMFAEFDGPRNRKVYVQFSGE